MIADHNLPLGQTENGKAWALKALHPSDPITTTRGIPDESCVPSVFMNYQSTYTVASKNGEDSWGFDMTLTPHPVSFACISQLDADAGRTVLTPLLNTQLTGETHSAKFSTFRSIADRWRLAYMSVTLQQDAPALADQGSIAACQSIFAPIKQNFSYQSEGNLWAARPIICSTVGDQPTFDKLQSMPGAYFTKSKEGCYMPLKLTRTCQNWRSDSTNVYMSYSAVPAGQNGSLPFPSAQNNDTIACYPLPGIAGVSYNIVTGAFVGEVTSDLCNDSVGFISVTNVAPGTRFTVFIRAGYELQVLPGSLLTPQQMLSPEHDEVALATYFAIARKMKDAYPADYNDLGKIWEVIKGAARTVLPILTNIPGIPGLIARGASTALSVGESLRNGFKNVEGQLERSRKHVASQDDIEQLQDVAKAASRPARVYPNTQRRRRRPVKRGKSPSDRYRGKGGFSKRR